MITQLFIECKYKKWYDAICCRAQTRETPNEPCEKHHIIPKSLGGSNDAANIARLTLREHYLAHICLTKCTTGEPRRKMLLAMRMMNKGQRKGSIKNSSLYTKMKQAAHEARIEQCKTPEYREKMRLAAIKRNKNSEYRQKLSETAILRSRNPLYKERQRLSHLGKKHTKSWTLSLETRERQRNARLKYWAGKQA